MPDDARLAQRLLPAEAVADGPPSTPEVPQRQPEAAPVVVTRADWIRAARFSLVVFLSVRCGLLLIGLISTALLPRNAPPEVPGWPVTDPGRSWHHLFTSFERFDALWFLRIASQGYRTDDASAAFFPLYPLLSGAVGRLLGDQWLLGAYVVSHVSLVAGLTVLYRLTALEFSDAMARRTVLYLSVFPTAFFLYAPYSEPLFLALSVGCLYAARRQSWLLAGYLGALACATRSTGLLLVLPLAVEAVLQFRSSVHPWRTRALRLSAGLAASAATATGLIAYFLYWQSFAGDWSRPLDAQGTWGRDKSWPWETMLAGLREGTRYFGVYSGGYQTVDLVLVVLALLAGLWIALRVRLTYSLYYWAALIFPMTLSFGGRPFLSMPRFMLVMFPLFWALAGFAQRWRAHEAVVAASAAGMGLLTVLFVNWYFIF